MFDLILGYLTIGLVNGSFYALLALGLALIFGLLNVLNMTHGALYMMGAFAAWAAVEKLGVDYLSALVIATIGVGAVGVLIEKMLLSRTYGLDPLYGFMLTFGLATILQGLFQVYFGSTGLPFSAPGWLSGGIDFGFIFLPVYRLWVVGVSLLTCLAAWLAIERTRAGATLRAVSENSMIADALGVRVSRVRSLAFGLGAALAGFAGALAAPVYQVSPLMGADILLVIFAIIIVGGMGSIGGTLVASYCLALIESLTQAFYPQAASSVIFVFMCVVLMVRPQGLFGLAMVKRHEFRAARLPGAASEAESARSRTGRLVLYGAAAVVLLLLPVVVYPIHLVKIACLAMFAASFNFLIGFVGIVSFGQAAFFGTAAYVTAHALAVWKLSPEIALLLGLAAALTLGLIMGALAIRRGGIYQAMITLAVAQMVYFVYVQAPFTHAEDGIQSVPRGVLLGLLDLRDDRTVYGLAVCALICVFCGLRALLSSRFGMVLVAIRDDERRAQSLGYNVDAYKLAAFAIASVCAGLAGSISAIGFQLATLSGAHWQQSGEAVLMALLGGIGTLTGPILGAAITTMLQQWLAPFGAWVQVFQGIVFALCVLLFRDGLLSRLAELVEKMRKTGLRAGLTQPATGNPQIHS